MRTKIMVTLGAMLCVMLSVPAMATEIALDVPNYSFESPVTSSYYFGVGQWGRVGNAGTFSNSAGYGTPIANCNGNQMVFLGNTTGYMMWTDMPVILTKGTYTLSVGVAARSDSVPSDRNNSILDLRILYRPADNPNVPVILAQEQVVHADLSTTSLTYYTVTLNSEDIPDEAVGTVFGPWFECSAGTGGDWTLDNVTMTQIPMSAFSPTPADGETGVGTIEDMSVTLSWWTGRDPNALFDQVNPNITDHYLYLTDRVTDEGDPNFADVEPIIISAGVPTAETASEVKTLLTDKTYYWRVDESVSESGVNDPNTILGRVWSFGTIKSVPVIETQPVDQFAGIGESAEISIEVTSLSTEHYQWYKSTDNANDTPGDTTVGTDSDTLTIAPVTATDEAYYYCVVTNNGGTETSEVASLEIKTVVAWYEFEDDLTDSEGTNDGMGYDFSGPVTYDENGIAGKALKLTGSGEYVNIPRSIDNSFSIAMWVKTTASGPTGHWSEGWGLLAGYDEIEPNIEQDFGTSILGSGFGFGVGSAATIASTTSINDGEWHYCVATRNHVTGEIAVYVDGEQENTATGPLGVLEATGDLQFGKIKSFETAAQFDETQLYNYPLAEKEVASYYNAVTGEQACIRSLQPEQDLNNDCRVNLIDLSILAQEWTDCALLPECITYP